MGVNKTNVSIQPRFCVQTYVLGDLYHWVDACESGFGIVHAPRQEL